MSKKVNIGVISVIDKNGNTENIEIMGTTPESAVTKLYVDEADGILDTRVTELENIVGKMEERDINMDDLVSIITSGDAKYYFPVGDQLNFTYNYGGTEYSCPHNIVDYEDAIIQNDDGEEETVNAMSLEWHYTIPLSLAFDPDEALAEISSDGLPAGKYCVLIAGDSWGSKNGLYYSFEVTTSLTEGMQLKPSGSYNSTSSTSFNMYVYKDGKTFTPTYTFPMTLESSLPSDAVFLGSYGGTDYDSSIVHCFKVPYTKNGVDRILNHYHCVYLGNNCWALSGYRQWLNGDSDWSWTSQHPCDRANSTYVTLSGFLSGYSDEFKSKLYPKKCITYRNTAVYDDVYDITYDKIFLHSMANINVDGFTSQQNTGGLEGDAWEYYKDLASGQSNLNTNGTFKAWSTYPILIKYALNAKTSAQYVFSRSAYRSYGYNVLSVYASGYVSNSTASDGRRCLPACIIAGTAL